MIKEQSHEEMVVFTGRSIMDYHYQGNKSELIEKMLMMNKMKFVTLSMHKITLATELADQKAKIREWAKKTFTPENMEDKFGITVTKYECENLLKEFEEAINETRTI